MPRKRAPLRLEVAFTPAELAEPSGKVCAVIDVLRASSSIVAMFAGGLEELILAASVEDARAVAQEQRGVLLCGEQGGLPPEGFDHGNSPAEFAGLDLAGRRAVMATTNGTNALARAAACEITFVGSLLNVSAAAAAMRDEARRRRLDLAVLCAGSGSGRYFSLEDAFCAGALVEELLTGVEDRPAPWSSAIAARRLYRSYRGSAMAAFRASDHGASLVRLGFARDLEFCGQRDRFSIVPRLVAKAGCPLRIVRGDSAG